jgi:hypothetical protein
MMMMSVVLFMAGRLLQPRLIVHLFATAPPFNTTRRRTRRKRTGQGDVQTLRRVTGAYMQGSECTHMYDSRVRL